MQTLSADDGRSLRGIVSRKAFLGEIIDYQVTVGGQDVRVQKGRRALGPEVGEGCNLHFRGPAWYAGEP
ncbi:MAG: TOBE domain-containing protein [Sporomusa sp.]